MSAALSFAKAKAPQLRLSPEVCSASGGHKLSRKQAAARQGIPSCDTPKLAGWNCAAGVVTPSRFPRSIKLAGWPGLSRHSSGGSPVRMSAAQPLTHSQSVASPVAAKSAFWIGCAYTSSSNIRSSDKNFISFSSRWRDEIGRRSCSFVAHPLVDDGCEIGPGHFDVPLAVPPGGR